MSESSSSIIIRTSRLSDEEDLIEICHLTGDTRIDAYLLALRWCLDYLWYDTENCFVAEDTETGRVAGYIVGTLDTRQQEQRLMEVMLPKIKAHWKSVRPKTLACWQNYLLMRSSLRNPDSKLLAEYPAHLHINVHPDHQGKGLGSRLIAAYEKNLIQNGVRGYHLGVGGDNQIGISFYKRQGLDNLGKIPGPKHPLVIYYGRRLDLDSQDG